MKTEYILEYCRLSVKMRKWHAPWCELENNLWYCCDCGYTDDLQTLSDLLYSIKRM